MFVKQSVHLRHPIKEVTASLLEGSPSWFPRDDKNVSSVGLHVAGVPVKKQVVVEIGEPVKTTSWTMFPLTWKATFPVKLFPEMTGKIEFDAVGQNETRLTVSGMYEPPLGRVGKELDDALMHRLAEGTVKELAESIAERLEGSLR